MAEVSPYIQDGFEAAIKRANKGIKSATVIRNKNTLRRYKQNLANLNSRLNTQNPHFAVTGPTSELALAEQLRNLTEQYNREGRSTKPIQDYFKKKLIINDKLRNINSGINKINKQIVSEFSSPQAPSVRPLPEHLPNIFEPTPVLRAPISAFMPVAEAATPAQTLPVYQTHTFNQTPAFNQNLFELQQARNARTIEEIQPLINKRRRIFSKITQIIISKLERYFEKPINLNNFSHYMRITDRKRLDQTRSGSSRGRYNRLYMDLLELSEEYNKLFYELDFLRQLKQNITQIQPSNAHFGSLEGGRLAKRRKTKRRHK